MTDDFALARENMIEQQIRPWEVLDARVLDVFRQVPRHLHVPAPYRSMAYVDVAIPLGHGEKMMKPVQEGRMLQALDLTGSEEILEIGTGSGFITACLARLGGNVHSIERHDDLASAARQRLTEAGVANVQIETADALDGFEPPRRYDAIVVTGAVDSVPPRFGDWLAVGGRLFIVHGRAPLMTAALVTRTDGSHLHQESLFETELDYLHGAAPVAQFSL
ncbi:MAG: protein-L-isoaspartate O-methyltransferase [Xanthomonadales bacterium]|nr:protein-L-isoaspartate O-methyltransferase [Xanthomonadales bacterium]